MLNRRELSKALTRIANASVGDMLAYAPADGPGHARIIGITGSPGAGKSTLIGSLALRRLEDAASLAVLAIDPTSPCTSGSLLGDRIRMPELSDHPRVFLRSLPSRAAEDGLTQNIVEMMALLDGAGFDEIIIETVGAGQTAYGIRDVADLVVLVLTPGSGDYVQAMKAGIMETADIYVVNKSDLPGADRVVAEVLGVLKQDQSGRVPPVIQLHQADPAGIDQLAEAIRQSLLPDSGRLVAGDQRRRSRRRYQVHGLLQRRLEEIIASVPESHWDLAPEACYSLLMRLMQRGSS